jgi:hypothetical protein
MALTKEEINNIIKSYVDLLIIQYNDKPKARATIEALTSEVVDNGVAFEVQDAFNIDTAIGNQLDIVGKYAGVDRSASFEGVNFENNYFSLIENNTTLGADVFGLVENAEFGTIDAHILGAENDDFITVTQLDDDDYRFIIKLRIVQNNINHSYAAINDAIFQSFGDDLLPVTEAGSMMLSYFVNSDIVRLAEIAFKKGVLPIPIGVGLQYLIRYPANQKFFGFTDINGNSPPNIEGFAGEGKFLDQSDLISN